ncbi:MAG: trehalase family glycosidase [Chloroflexota bacterium]
MREWHLAQYDPLSLTLAADQRFCHPDRNNDQVWELSLGGGDPSTLSLQTTYGLRARSMRIFPRFVEAGIPVSDPLHFFKPPRLVKFFPNYAEVAFSPFKELTAVIEYWVLESQLVAGRVHITNQGESICAFTLEIAAVLVPMGHGQATAPRQRGLNTCIQGQSSKIFPVLVMSGGPDAIASPFPALSVNLRLKSGDSGCLSWACSSEKDPEACFEHARKAIRRDWDAELARIELFNDAQYVDIHTGEKDWDVAFALSQKLAYSLLFPADAEHPFINAVNTRTPDQSYPKINSLTDTGQTSDTLSTLDLYYLTGQLLPSNPQLVKDLIKNALISQEENDAIHWETGSRPRAPRRLAIPLLANIAWRVYELDQDKEFLKSIFPQVQKNVQTWFDEDHDRDQDGLPEWDSADQVGLENAWLFDPWRESNQGLRIETVESPALGAFLVQELGALTKIAHELGDLDSGQIFQKQHCELSNRIRKMWHSKKNCFRYWDRDTHLTPRGKSIIKTHAPHILTLESQFEQPQRLLIHLKSGDEMTRMCTLTIKGCAADGSPFEERITPHNIIWIMGRANLTSENVYQKVNSIEVSGLKEQDFIEVKTVKLTPLDITCLLPLWAGLVNERQVKALIMHHITCDHPAYQFGIPETLVPAEHFPYGQPIMINLPWNLLILEGLLSNGMQAEARNIFTRIMHAITHALKEQHAFYEYYDARTGRPAGRRNALSGLAPIGFFMQLVGVRIFSPEKVIISGENPFPWPVTIKFRGLQVTREGKNTHIILPDGQTIDLHDSETRLISLE